MNNLVNVHRASLFCSSWSSVQKWVVQEVLCFKKVLIPKYEYNEMKTEKLQ